jgi:Coenzyme PQQ synthesis protein D (PqqD)
MTDVPALAAALATDRYTHTSLADGTGVILDIEGMHVLTLNQTGEFLIAAVLAGAADEADLAGRLVAEFEVEEPQARDDVGAFLAEMSQYLE